MCNKSACKPFLHRGRSFAPTETKYLCVQMQNVCAHIGKHFVPTIECSKFAPTKAKTLGQKFAPIEAKVLHPQRQKFCAYRRKKILPTQAKNLCPHTIECCKFAPTEAKKFAPTCAHRGKGFATTEAEVLHLQKENICAYKGKIFAPTYNWM